jgi:hypothetical protein
MWEEGEGGLFEMIGDLDTNLHVVTKDNRFLEL